MPPIRMAEATPLLPTYAFITCIGTSLFAESVGVALQIRMIINRPDELQMI